MFGKVPKVTPSASRAATEGWPEGAAVSRAKVHSKVPQKVTPWKNHVVETKPLIGNYARQPVTPCRSQFEPSFCFTRRAQFPETPRRNRTSSLCTGRRAAVLDIAVPPQ